MEFYLKSINSSGRSQLVTRFVPIEMLSEIICRVPALSVLKSKIVCKRWSEVINMPEFVEKHLRSQLLQLLHFHDYKYYPRLKNSNGAGDIGILLHVIERHEDDDYDEEPNDYYFDVGYAEYHENGNNPSSVTNPKMLTHLNISSADRLISSCDGLVCLSKQNGAYVSVCNPMIGEYIDLPRCGKNKQLRYGFGSTNTDTKEYKVVRIIYNEKKHAVVQVYTLGSGTGWRDKGRFAYSLRNDPGAFVDGALHWLDNKGKIWAFDLVDEEFKFLTQTPNKTGNFSLTVLGGWLSYFQHGTKHTTLWAFRKIAKEQQSLQWSAIFSLRMPGNCLPFALTIMGEVLCWRNDESLLVYNPENGASRELQIENLETMNSEFLGILHVNSFLSLRTIGENDVQIIGADG